MSDSIFKVASNPKANLALKILGNLGAGAGQSVFYDQVYHDDASIGDSLKAIFTPEGFRNDKQRALMGLFNTGLGAAGTHYLTKKPIDATEAAGNTAKGLGLILSAPAKDAMMAGGGLAAEARKALPEVTEDLDKMTDNAKGLSDKEKLVAAILGLGALGVGAYGAHRLSKSLDAQSNAANAGRVMVTLPTKNPNDIETQVSIPLVDTGVSAKTYQQLGRDVRRRLRGESKERKLAYLKAIEAGMEPSEADMLKTSTENKNVPQGFLAGSHIKAIAKEHAPAEPQEPMPEPEQDKTQPLNAKLTEQNKKLSEQEKRIKQLEKYLGQVNGNKLGRVRENLRGLNKSSNASKVYSPTLNEVNSTPEAFNSPGGVQGSTIMTPMLFGPGFDKIRSQVKPYLDHSSNPLISRLFGYTKPSPNAIVPMK
jgi:uncharacterized membrane protein YgdD (TMEM256/DUF423 family)